MTKPVLLFVALFCLLTPLSALADDHDEVTIRIMQMDEETPDSVINRIQLPALEDEAVMGGGMRAPEDNGFAHQDMGFAEEMGNSDFEAGMEVQGMQNEISTQGHGK